MVTEIEGTENRAIIHLDEDQVEDSAYEQIEEMANQKGFRSQGDIVIQPDTHKGHGAVIGFTMPLPRNPLRLVPSCIGVDIGCAIRAVKLGKFEELDWKELDPVIRENVPMGWSTHDRGVYHMENDFPYDKANEKLEDISEELGRKIEPNGFSEFSPEYFHSLCKRVGYSEGKVISSAGTLGGGNHFVEISRTNVKDREDELWAVIHSGSRGIGNTTATYWMEYATNLRNVDKIKKQIPDELRKYVKFDFDDNPMDLFEWVTGGKGETYKKEDKIREDYINDNPERIDEIHDELKVSVDTSINPYAYLEGEEADGYLGDMIFLQLYAEENRRLMGEAVAEAMDREIEKSISSVHNYIDFEDQIIRKGATPAREGQEAIIPLDMSTGSLLVEGKGNPDWNYSVCHGAGRVMSRGKAKDTIDLEDFKEQMKDIYSTSVCEETLDEAPDAYKDPEMIMTAIQDTVDLKKRLYPVHNLKALD